MKAPNTIIKLAMLAIALAFVKFVPAHAQVTSNVYLRTRLIQVDNLSGTAFTIDIDRRQYLITARHLVGSITDGAQAMINIRKRDVWSPLLVTVFKCREPIDIAVLVPPSQVTVNYRLEATHAGTAFGQEVYFVGFPFGEKHATTIPTWPGVWGIVRRATIAQLQWLPELQTQEFWLDGMNNEGFSGSPVVFQDIRYPGSAFKVGGVISGYEYQTSPVYDRIEIREQDITPADRMQNSVEREGDKIYRLKPTGQVVRSNTGLAVAWDITSAVELIHKHPIGPTVSDTFNDSQNGY